MLTFKQLQEEQSKWSEYNFGLTTEETEKRSMYGIAEEYGELCHALLKQEQKIRMDQDHVADAKDSVGDLVIFVAQLCNAKGWDFQRILEETWAKVKKRDWITYPENGLTS